MKSKEEKKAIQKAYRASSRGKITIRAHEGTPERKRKRKGYGLKEKYNITLEQYNEMLIKQNSKCATCGKDQSKFKRAFDVDHNHITGKIRGLLCINCNLIIGNAYENINTLKEIIDYLNKHNEL